VAALNIADGPDAEAGAGPLGQDLLCQPSALTLLPQQPPQGQRIARLHSARSLALAFTAA
jgi:hypothetical protein